MHLLGAGVLFEIDRAVDLYFVLMGFVPVLSVVDLMPFSFGTVAVVEASNYPDHTPLIAVVAAVSVFAALFAYFAPDLAAHRFHSSFSSVVEDSAVADMR